MIGGKPGKRAGVGIGLGYGVGLFGEQEIDEGDKTANIFS